MPSPDVWFVQPHAAGSADPVFAVGFSARKRRFLRDFVNDRPLRFVSHFSQVPRGAEVMVWGSVPVPPELSSARVWRVEDGFLRSVGLGAAFAPPLSWVVDGEGLHYDATRGSALETLLNTVDFSPELCMRAANLRRAMVKLGMTKYNLAGPSWQRPRGCTRQVCLVVGQVESDASLALGSPQIRSNLKLLQQVRLARPDAYLVYKPHPDVHHGVRGAGAGEADVAQYCDEVLPDADMGHLLNAVDECHVLTSLAGFEALMRGVIVHTYGQPFYAGWGLTVDALPAPRRGRVLSLDALVAAALILYPRYRSGVTGQRVDAETALTELAAEKGVLSRRRRWRSGFGTWLGRTLSWARGRRLPADRHPSA